MIPLQVTHQIQDHIEEKEVEEKRRRYSSRRSSSSSSSSSDSSSRSKSSSNVKVSLRREGIIAITHEVVIT